MCVPIEDDEHAYAGIIRIGARTHTLHRSEDGQKKKDRANAPMYVCVRIKFLVRCP